MRYEKADDIQRMAEEIVEKLNLRHIDTENIACIRSHGSKTRGVIARCHALGKLMQKAMKNRAFYAIEFLERFDKMPMSEQDKVISSRRLLHRLKEFIGSCWSKKIRLFYYKKEVIIFVESESDG